MYQQSCHQSRHNARSRRHRPPVLCPVPVRWRLSAKAYCPQRALGSRSVRERYLPPKCLNTGLAIWIVSPISFSWASQRLVEDLWIRNMNKSAARSIKTPGWNVKAKCAGALLLSVVGIAVLRGQQRYQAHSDQIFDGKNHIEGRPGIMKNSPFIS